MNAGNALSTATLLRAFTKEVGRHGGRVTDKYDDGRRLFARSILPRVQEVRKHDKLQGGVALRSTGDEVSVHPYVFRLVCKNGAIQAHSVASRMVTFGYAPEPEEVADAVQEAVAACCEPDVFTNSLDQIRSSVDVRLDLALNVLPMLAQLGAHVGSRFVRQIVDRFLGDRDHTQFGLMNAVTSVARDTTDAEARWNLEEFGGGVPVMDPRVHPKAPSHSNARRAVAMVS